LTLSPVGLIRVGISVSVVLVIKTALLVGVMSLP
jgi:hypothetical protein